MIDSSLSALDVKVQNKVFDRAVQDICRDKLVILVTHDLNLASRMDKVIYIQSKNNQCHIMDADEFQVQIDELRETLGPNLSN